MLLTAASITITVPESAILLAMIRKLVLTGDILDGLVGNRDFRGAVLSSPVNHEPGWASQAST
jgi:hypothetical protein